MLETRTAWMLGFALLAGSVWGQGLPHGYEVDGDGVARLQQPLQGLDPTWDLDLGGADLRFLTAPAARFVLTPFEAGRSNRELSLALPAEHQIDGNRLTWTVPRLRQDFDATSGSLTWTFELDWKSPAPEAEGPAYVDFIRRQEGLSVRMQEDGRLLFETEDGSERLGELRELVVEDASGRRLPTWLEHQALNLPNPLLRLFFDDSDAERPFRFRAEVRGARTWLEPEERGSAYARRVVAAGDVNADGHADLAVSARRRSANGTDAGRVLVYLGSDGGYPLTADWVRDGEGAGDLLGADIAGAGDVNGDGFDDLLVGEPGRQRVSLFLGGPDGLGETAAWSFQSALAETDLGWAVALAGDLNDDGFDELVLGEPRANGAAGLEAGRFSLFLGGPEGPASVADLVVEGSQAFSRFGGTLAEAGDVDGDGFEDLLVGAPLHDGLADDSGRAFLFLGDATGLDPNAQVLTEGALAGARCGEALAGLGDLDGDGLGDVAAGCPGEAPGRVSVFFGPEPGREQQLEGLETEGLFGAALAGGADVDGDGRPELIVGAPGRGDSRGAALVYQLVGDAFLPLLSVDGEDPITQSGIAVAALGDADRDGFAEIAIGSWYATGPLGWAQGRVSVIPGRGSGPQEQPQQVVVAPIGANRAAPSVESAGDLNGDGYDDLLVHGRDGDAAQGDVAVWFGSSTGLATLPDWVPPALHADSVRLAAAGVGDVNGDGFDDLVFGGSWTDTGGDRFGRATLHLGGPMGPSPEPDWSVEGSTLSQHLGSQVSPAGDVNGDGLADFLVVSAGLQEVAVFHGSHSLPLLEPAATLPCESVSRPAGAGDLDGDGFGDVVLITPNTRRALAVFGSINGLSTADSMDFGSANQFRPLGDLDGDGRPEFAMESWGTWAIHGSNLQRSHRKLGKLPSRTNAVEAAGDVDGDGRDEVLRRERAWSATSGWSLLRLDWLGPSTAASWTRVDQAVPVPIAAFDSASLDLNGDGLSDVVLSRVSSGGDRLETFPGSSGRGSRRAPVLGRHGGAGPHLRAGQALLVDETLELEFGLDMPGGEDELVIEWKLDESDPVAERSEPLDSGAAARDAASFVVDREGLHRPRYRLSGSEPVPWTSPWYRLPHLGGSVELRTHEDRPPTCDLSNEQVAPGQVLFHSMAQDPDREPLELTWSFEDCPQLDSIVRDDDEGTALASFNGCAGECSVEVTVIDGSGLTSSCESDFSWSALGVTAGPDKSLSCSEVSVVLQGFAGSLDPTHPLEVRWEPAAGLSDPTILTPTASAGGDYTLTVTNLVTGCVEVDEVSVVDLRENAQLVTRVTHEIDCEGQNGRVEVVVSPPGDYTYAWSPVIGVVDPDSAATIVLWAGTYTVVVTSRSSGCVYTAGVEVIDRSRQEVSALDRRPEAPPLLVTRPASDRVHLSWEDTKTADWSIYRGSLRSLREDRSYDHAPNGACHFSLPETALGLPAEDSYYLVASDCGPLAPAFGRDSFGSARGAALSPCP